MDRRVMLLLSATLLPSSWAAPAAGQSPGYGPQALEHTASTRGLALGTAYVLSSADAELLFANPGLIPNLSGFQGSLITWAGEGTGGHLAAAGEWWGGGVAAGLRFLEFGAASDDPGAAAGVGDALPEEGGPGASQWVATLGYGREIKGFLVGLSGHLMRDRLEDTSSTGAALDVGIARSVGPVMLGLSGQNLGPDLELGGADIPLPYRVTLGASSRRTWVGPLDVGATAALSYRADGEWIPAGGVEVAWWPVLGRTFVGRVGYRRVPTGSQNGWTVGGGFEGDRIGLDYAYQGYDGFDAAHRVGIRLR
jgi:hypothetical protein